MTVYCPEVLDTLKLAKDIHPGQKNNLDALCRRYEVDNTNRTFHGALLDAELLAAVYLGMTRGQESLMMDVEVASSQVQATNSSATPIRVISASTDELSEHEATLAVIQKESRGACLWLAEAQ
jgi:DNA polymerase-3 subunit epsilon